MRSFVEGMRRSGSEGLRRSGRLPRFLNAVKICRTRGFVSGDICYFGEINTVTRDAERNWTQWRQFSPIFLGEILVKISSVWFFYKGATIERIIFYGVSKNNRRKLNFNIINLSK